MTDLSRLKFTLVESGQIYQADDTSEAGVAAWTSLVARVANVKDDIDWTDLEEREHFVNKLHAFCQEHDSIFPLEIVPENATQEEEKN